MSHILLFRKSLRDTEIAKLKNSIFDENILSFQITMQNLFTVQSQQGERDLSCIHKYLILGELQPIEAMLLNELSQAATLGIFHNYKDLLIFNERLVEFDDGWPSDYS